MSENETVEVPLADLEALKEWMEGDSPNHRLGPIHAALIAHIPWQPSEEDVAAYCHAHGYEFDNPSERRASTSRAVAYLRLARHNGYDAVPRRLDGT